MPETKSSSQRGYGYRWQKVRDGFLKKHPLCEYHSKMGMIAAAVVVDHKIPHRGDMQLFWDRDNWQALCKGCHDRIKQQQEKSGVAQWCGIDGTPLDANHHWNKG